MPPTLPCSAAQALVHIQAASGRHFDPQVVGARVTQLTRRSDQAVAPARVAQVA
jgi:response regulator RpfG family c-di-GMP phosphodiesterase